MADPIIENAGLIEPGLFDQIESAIRAMTPPLAQTLAEASSLAWIRGAASSLDEIPQTLFPTSPGVEIPAAPPPPSIPLRDALFPGGEEPILRFPVLERAAERLAEAGLVEPEQFYTLGAEARRKAFTITTDMAQDSVDKIRRILAENIAAGADRVAFMNDVERVFDEGLEISDAHLEGVFRNNVNSAFSDGHESALQNPFVRDAFVYRSYNATADERVRPEHFRLEKTGLNGTSVYRQDDPIWKLFRPPWDWNAVMPDTEIQGRIMYGLKTFYSGQAFKLTLQSGRRLTVTANHPILTGRGFVAAKSLCKGEYLLDYQCPIDRHTSVPLNDIDRTPTKARQLFDSFRRITGAVTVKTSPLEFHGDAKFGNGQVDVVGANCHLLDDLKSMLAQSDRTGPLAVSDLNAAFLARQGAAVQYGRTGLSAAVEFPSQGQFGRPAVADYPVFCGVGSATNLDVPRFQACADGVPADAELFGQLQFAFPGFIQANQLVNIQSFHYSGSVFDFQTDVGYIVADGIVVSNCRCSFRPLTVRMAAREGVQEAKDWIARAEREGVNVEDTPPAIPEFVKWPTLGGERIEPDVRWRREVPLEI